MKKSLIFILISFLPFALAGQIELSGIYCLTSNAGFDSQCFNFNKDGLFEYYETSCLGVESFIEGSYEIIESKMRLTLKEDDEKFKLIIKDLPEEKNGQVSIHFRVSDIQKVGIQSTIFPDSLKLKDFSFEKHLTDPEGYLKWQERKENKKKLISVEPPSGPTIKFELDFNKSQMVLVKMLAPRPNSIFNRDYDFDLMSNLLDVISINDDLYYQKK